MVAACRAMSGVEPPFEVLWAAFCWRMRATKWREPCPRPLTPRHKLALFYYWRGWRAGQEAGG
jgi:hypothetical protein